MPLHIALRCKGAIVWRLISITILSAFFINGSWPLWYILLPEPSLSTFLLAILVRGSLLSKNTLQQGHRMAARDISNFQVLYVADGRQFFSLMSIELNSGFSQDALGTVSIVSLGPLFHVRCVFDCLEEIQWWSKRAPMQWADYP